MILSKLFHLCKLLLIIRINRLYPSIQEDFTIIEDPV